jgi:hypothetical protein
LGAEVLSVFFEEDEEDEDDDEEEEEAEESYCGPLFNTNQQ